MKLNPLAQKATAFCTALCFLYTQVVYADIERLLHARRQTSALEQILPQFQIPAELGTIDQLSSATIPSIVIIQDAHGHEEAQRNTQKLLEYMDQTYGVGGLFIEGGVGELDPNRLRFFNEPEFNKDAAEWLLQAGEIGGAEMFLLNKAGVTQKASKSSPKRGQAFRPVPFLHAHGLEDEETYLENLNAFQEVMRQKEGSEKRLEAVLSKISTQASHSLNTALHPFFKKWVRHEKGQLDLLTFLEYLRQQAKTHANLDLSDAYEQLSWPMLIRYFELQKRDPLLDLDKAEEEGRALIAWAEQQNIDHPLLDVILPARLLFGGSEAKDLSAQTSPVQDLRTLWEQFYLQAKPKGFQFNPYRNLLLHHGYLILKNELKIDALDKEIQKLQKHILGSLIQTEDERSFIKKFEHYLLIKKLLTLELTRKEWDEVKDSASDRFQLALNFYRLAQKRDTLMIQKLLDTFLSPHRGEGQGEGGPAILITGGFHTQGLTESLSAKGISFAVVTPPHHRDPRKQQISKCHDGHAPHRKLALCHDPAVPPNPPLRNQKSTY